MPINKIVNMYKNHKMTVVTLLIDKKLEWFRGDVTVFSLNTTVDIEHVP